MRVTRASAALLAGVPTAFATLWIPAFAGMTGVESGNDGVGSENDRVEIRNGGAAIVR